MIGNTISVTYAATARFPRSFARLPSAAGVHDARCRGSLVTKPDVPAQKRKKIYQKPELKTINAQVMIEKLRPLALAGDKTAQQLIRLITHKHDIR